MWCWNPTSRTHKDSSDGYGFDKESSPLPKQPFRRTKSLFVRSRDQDVKKLCRMMASRMSIGHIRRNSRTTENRGSLFGLPLEDTCKADNLPKPVMLMLEQLYAKGPSTQGIFRTCANARLVRELRYKLDSGETVEWENVPILMIAAIFKDFVRSLPDPLLSSAMYTQWKDAVYTTDEHQKLMKFKEILSQLPKYNYSLLCHFLCVLHHISEHSAENLMTSANLGLCVGPSLLWCDGVGLGDDLRAVPSLVEYLITHCQLLCSTDILHLLGDPLNPGAEDSEVFHTEEHKFTSGSEESGLTLSDCQLLTPELQPELQRTSTSSSGYESVFDNYSTANPSPLSEDVTFPDWYEQFNPNFQRDTWFRRGCRRHSSEEIRRPRSPSLSPTLMAPYISEERYV